MMKLPMKSMTVSSVKRPKTTSTDVSSSGGGGVASSNAHRTTPSSAVIGMGIASVTHQTTTKAKIAGQPVLVPVQIERDQEHDREHDRAEEQAYGPAPALEALLGRRQHSLLLVEGAVGLAPSYVLDFLALLLGQRFAVVGAPLIPRLGAHVRSDTRFGPDLYGLGVNLRLRRWLRDGAAEIGDLVVAD